VRPPDGVAPLLHARHSDADPKHDVPPARAVRLSADQGCAVVATGACRMPIARDTRSALGFFEREEETCDLVF